MSSINESLKRLFEKRTTSNEDDQCRNGTLEDIIEWFKKIQFFEKLEILQKDLETAFNKFKIKASVTFDDFIKVLKELAENNNIDVEELKRHILKLEEAFYTLDKTLQEDLKKGKASLKDVMEWLERHGVFDKVKIIEDDVAKVVAKMKQQASNIKYEDFSKAMKDLTAKYNINLDNLVKELYSPPVIPLTESLSNSQSKEN